jgi:FKBP-type peptidyl-prolyl cis-trans isomerase FklB
MSIRNIIAGSRNAASKYFFFIMALAGIISMTSCSESDEEEEFANWQSKNESYFTQIYTQAETAIKSGDNSWKIIPVYSKDATAAKYMSDYIVAHVETEGTGTESPIYSDQVRVHYRGNFIPSKSHSNGFQFDSSWTGEYNLKTMMPSSFSVSGTILGFTTALMNMHKGDRWTVYVPYNLAYGTSDYTPKDSQGNVTGSTIPAYSMLKFDLTLIDFIHKGESFPTFQ